VNNLGGGNYNFADVGETLIVADIGKTLVFIDSDGAELGRGLINAVVLPPLYEVEISVISGTIPAGAITGGFWGFSTEPVVDDGDYFMTAGGAYFAAPDVGDQVDVIDALGNVILEFEIMSFTSTTVVGVNLISGSLVATVYTGGTWDFTGGAITPAADYNLVSSSSYFVIGDIASVIRVIDTAGDEVATMTISGFTSDTQVATTLTSGTIAEGVITGGLWGFNSETPINIFLSNPKFILIAEVVGVGEQFEYDFEIPFANGIDASRVICVMNKIMPSNVILLIQFVPE
jgi:DNA-binding beta-propeller fold protein YncE